MKLSDYFLPLIKENPDGAHAVSHTLMLRAGLIQQHVSGIYNWLPIGTIVLRKVEEIIRQEQNLIGGLEIIMPSIQSADLWHQSGRYDSYGAEMLKMSDRHGNDMLYGPTYEEIVTEILSKTVFSYNDLPKLLYQIGWKFRDEIRPRFGVMRAREFLMKDAYSVDLDKVSSINVYNKVFLSYLHIFNRLGLNVIPVAADSGPIGGNLSHEFLVLADSGESNIWFDSELPKYLLSLTKQNKQELDCNKIVRNIISYYSVVDEKRDVDIEQQIDKNNLKCSHAIEVGHVFYFGTKYSEAMSLLINNNDGKQQHVHMGSYGIGISRLVAAIIEANHDDKGIIWPNSITPFQVYVTCLSCHEVSDRIYDKLMSNNISVLYDDRDVRPGVKFNTAELIGIPIQIIVSARTIKDDGVEIKYRSGAESINIKYDQIVDFCNSYYN